MTHGSSHSGPVPAAGGETPPGGEMPPPGQGWADSEASRRADRVLGLLADPSRLVTDSGSAGWWALAIGSAAVAGQVLAGVWLRHYLPPAVLLVAAACLAVTGWVLLLPPVPGRRRGDPDWVDAARTHQRYLAYRLPAARLAALTGVAAAAGQRTGQEAFLYVPRCRCARPGTAHAGLCHQGGLLAVQGRLIVMAGEHFAASRPEVITAMADHQARQLTGGPALTGRVLSVLGWAGPVFLGWTVPWPVLPAAVAALTLGRAAALWAVLVAADLGSARACGPDAVLAALDYVSGVRSGERAAVPAPERLAAVIAGWITGRPDSPLRLRRALITRLTRQNHPDTTGSAR